MMDTSGVTLFAATPGDAISEAAAREYIAANGYTSETVRLVRDKVTGQIRVIRR